MKVCVIGAGISGIAIANVLSANCDVILYEKEMQSGGLIKCSREEGNLFHRVGGHVFNSKNEKVLKWFWEFFDKENEFLKTTRNAKIFIDNSYINYPIENSLYKLPPDTLSSIVNDLIGKRDPASSYSNFAEFLEGTFGTTLYNFYFRPYNEKLWNIDLKSIPLDWLEGKLPMPNIQDIIVNNILRSGESDMVHSTFYYPKIGGSQFIIDRLAKNLKIYKGVELVSAKRSGKGWIVNNENYFDAVIYTGDIRNLGKVFRDPADSLMSELSDTGSLYSNGTSNVLCYTDDTELSWLYLPEKSYAAHRIIYTGNFSSTNNATRRNTCVVEFSGERRDREMIDELGKLPGNLRPIAYNYEPNSYVINTMKTRSIVSSIKSYLEPTGFYLLGRFAEWQYYNMDKCIEAAFVLSKKVMTNFK